MTSSPRSTVRRAFVFGGGGVLGFAWMVGALTALQDELGLEAGPDDLAVGTSAGAVLSALLGCNVDIASIRRHQLGMPLPEDPPISWNYQADSGGPLPPRPTLRFGSPGLVWEGIRRPFSVPPMVTLSGLPPRGRGTLVPIRRMVDMVMAEMLGERSWPERRTWIVTTDYSTGRRVVFGRDGDMTASLPDAVCASCAIPAWYAPVAIDGAAYVDGGTVSNTSTDLLFGEPLDEVYIFAPMAAVEPDRPRSPVSRVERRVRRAITRGIANDVAKLRADGAEVMLLTPGSEDLEAMGANLMNPRRRTEVLHTSIRTAAAAIRAQSNSDPLTAETGTP